MADLEWTPLPEHADERRMFDSGTQLHGDVRLNIANILRIFAVAHPGGSYADQCRIMANEVVKLELPSGVPASCPNCAGWKLVAESALAAAESGERIEAIRAKCGLGTSGVLTGAPGATDVERAAWLADKIGALGDYAKEAAAMLRRWPSGVALPRDDQQEQPR